MYCLVGVSGVFFVVVVVVVFVCVCDYRWLQWQRGALYICVDWSGQQVQVWLLSLSSKRRDLHVLY